jgi:hypothetical protein
MDRETKLEIGVGVVGVGGFILALVLIGIQYGDGGLGEQGGIALIGAFVGFIFAMTALGYWLSGQRE